MHFEALGIETKGAFGNGSNWRQGGRNKATKDLARDEMGNPLYVNFNQPQYVAPPPGEKVKQKNSGNQGQNKRESNPEKNSGKFQCKLCNDASHRNILSCSKLKHFLKDKKISIHSISKVQ